MTAWNSAGLLLAWVALYIYIDIYSSYLHLSSFSAGLAAPVVVAAVRVVRLIVSSNNLPTSKLCNFDFAPSTTWLSRQARNLVSNQLHNSVFSSSPDLHLSPSRFGVT